jgi:hypothetical protein
MSIVRPPSIGQAQSRNPAVVTLKQEPDGTGICRSLDHPVGVGKHD